MINDFRSKLLTIEPGVDVNIVASILENIDRLSPEVASYSRPRPVVRGLSGGQVAVYVERGWRP